MRTLIRTALSPRHRTLTLVLFLLLLTAFVALGTGFWVLFRITYLFALAIPAAWLLTWYNTLHLDVTVERRTDRGQVGQEAQEVIEVRNRFWLPKLWLDIEDPSDMPGHRSRRIVTIPPRRSRSWIVDSKLLRRGLYDWGPLRVIATDPFGFFQRTRTFGEAQQILIYPPVVDLPHFQAPPANLPGEGRWRRRTHYVTPNASGIREYEPGDAFNRIHWKSFARTQKLMVKTFELDPDSDIWIMLDLEKRLHHGTGDDSTEEYCVRVAASIAQHYIAQNRSVGFISFGRTLRTIEPERGGNQMTRVMESLAMASAVGEAPLGNIMMEEQRRFGRHTTLVVVTPSTEDHWLLPVQSLTQRGVRAAAVLVDPSTFSTAADSPLILFGELTASDILTYVVRKGDDLSLALTPSVSGVASWQG